MNFKIKTLVAGLFLAGQSIAAEFVDPPVVSSVGGVLDIVMEAKSKNLDGLPNTPEGATFHVCRNQVGSVNNGGACLSPLNPYGGVRLQLNPGDRLKIKLLNELKPASNDPELDDFQKLNPTNLHLHGFLVAPEWPAHPADMSGTLNPPPWSFGDNIFGMVRAAFDPGTTTPSNVGPGNKVVHVHGVILPQDEMDLSVKIPSSHPSGLSFFHPHVHGLTGRQIASGLSGILTVGSLNDNVTNWPSGGVEVKHVILKDAQIVKSGSTVTLQNDQNPGFCSNDSITNPAGACDADPVSGSQWVFTLSGQQFPKFTLKPTGQIWRITNSSPNVTYNLQLKKAGSPMTFQVLSVDGVTVTPASLGQSPATPGLSNGDACPGTTKTASLCTKTLHMMPGSRADVWIVNRDASGKVIPGDGSMATLSTAGYQTGPNADNWPAIDLGQVMFPKASAPTLPPALTLNDAHQTTSGINFNDIASNLATENAAVGPNLDKTRDCKALPAGWKRRVYLGYPTADTFGVGLSTVDPTGHESVIQGVESFPFAANSVCTSMTNLQASYETWEIVNLTPEDHNFHIHQTRFKVYPLGADTSTLNPILGIAEQDSAVIPAAKELVQGGCPGDSPANWAKLNSPDTTKICRSDPVTIRVPFAIAGDFVFHCHILEHEDKGMMGVVHVSSETH